MLVYVRTAMRRCLRHPVVGERSVSSSAFKQWLPPRRVLDVPLDRFIEAFLEIVARFPVQFALRKRRVNRVPAILTEAAAHTEIYTLPLHDAIPISPWR